MLMQIDYSGLISYLNQSLVIFSKISVEGGAARKGFQSSEEPQLRTEREALVNALKRLPFGSQAAALP
jgi:hypothetical protein